MILSTDLLIDDIEREDTQTVELLFPRRRPHRVEGAAGDGGEDGTEGVGLLQAGGLVVTEVDHHLGAISTQRRDKL